jgi:hypothetical protein
MCMYTRKDHYICVWTQKRPRPHLHRVNEEFQFRVKVPARCRVALQSARAGSRLGASSWSRPLRKSAKSRKGVSFAYSDAFQSLHLDVIATFGAEGGTEPKTLARVFTSLPIATIKNFSSLCHFNPLLIKRTPLRNQGLKTFFKTQSLLSCQILKTFFNLQFSFSQVFLPSCLTQVHEEKTCCELQID